MQVTHGSLADVKNQVMLQAAWIKIDVLTIFK